MGDLKNSIKQIVQIANDKNKKINEDLQKNAKTFQAFTLILYKETTSYNYEVILNKLINYCNDNNFKYAYIYHDKDIYRDPTFDNEYNLIGNAGEIKKPHYHFVVICNKQVERLSITSLFENDVIDNSIYNNLRSLKPNKIDNAILYLTHSAYRDKDKFQYPITEITSNITDYCNYLYNNRANTGEIFVCLKEYLRNNKKYISYIELDDLFNNNHIENSVINSNYYRIRDMLREHNEEYNRYLDLDRKNMKLLTQQIKKVEKDNSITSKLVDVFDTVDIVEGDTIKTITLFKTRKKDKKK